MSVMRILCGLVLIIYFTSSSAWAQTPTTAGSLHSCDYAEGESAPVRGNVPFPDGDLFRPILADPKEPRVSFQFLRFRPDGGDTMNIGAISAGGVVGVWARRALNTCDGLQVSLIGGVFTHFNLDTYSNDLINSDFLIGAQAATRGTGISGRLRVLHQSSHLGEDRQFVTTELSNFGYQAIDGLVSIDRPWWRAYGGAGYLFFMHDGSQSAMLQAGAELRSEVRAKGVTRPVAGVNISALQARAWGVSTNVLVGFEWTSPAASRRIRGSVLYGDGYTSFGQFALQQKSRTFGLQLQIEF